MTANERSTTWRYGVCGLLLCATMLLYMDRLTLSVLAKRICDEYHFTNEQYGSLDMGLSYAFAVGALVFGFLVDWTGPRFLYPVVLTAWSAAGIATAFSESIGASLVPSGDASEQAYYGFMACRVTLGFFESGHWPCALVTTQLILSRADRTLGNGILQSGASVGSVVTPMIVLALEREQPGGWRLPFTAIGCLGAAWIVPWLLIIRHDDLRARITTDAAPEADASPRGWIDLARMLVVLIAIVICINLTWQYFRVWLPKYLQETHHYDVVGMSVFIAIYYAATDIGCIFVGFRVKGMVKRGWDVHRARVVTFSACAGLTLIAVAVAFLPAANLGENGFLSTGSLLLLSMLLLVAAGSLGLYPNYYSFTQELSRKHQGKVSGILGTVAWIGSGTMQWLAGRNIDETKSYSTGIAIAGCLPAVACLVLWFVWPTRRAGAESPPTEPPTTSPATGIKVISNQVRET